MVWNVLPSLFTLVNVMQCTVVLLKKIQQLLLGHNKMVCFTRAQRTETLLWIYESDGPFVLRYTLVSYKSGSCKIQRSPSRNFSPVTEIIRGAHAPYLPLCCSEILRGHKVEQSLTIIMECPPLIDLVDVLLYPFHW